MIIKKEIGVDELRDMVWSGAADRVADLTDNQIETILNLLEQEFPPDGDVEDLMDETDLNDFFWFEDDTYAEWLGYRNADQLWDRAGKDADYYSIDYTVDVSFADNPQFTTSESIEDQLDSIIEFEDDYDFINDVNETYDDATDTWGGSVVIDISQSGMDKLREAGITFTEV